MPSQIMTFDLSNYLKFGLAFIEDSLKLLKTNNTISSFGYILEEEYQRIQGSIPGKWNSERL